MVGAVGRSAVTRGSQVPPCICIGSEGWHGETATCRDFIELEHSNSNREKLERWGASTNGYFYTARVHGPGAVAPLYNPRALGGGDRRITVWEQPQHKSSQNPISAQRCLSVILASWGSTRGGWWSRLAWVSKNNQHKKELAEWIKWLSTCLASAKLWVQPPKTVEKVGKRFIKGGQGGSCAVLVSHKNLVTVKQNS
jgi:hypothetical protein